MANCYLLLTLNVSHIFYQVFLMLTCRLTCFYFVGCQMLFCFNLSNLIYFSRALSNCAHTYSHQLSPTFLHFYPFEPTLTHSHPPSPTLTHLSTPAYSYSFVAKINPISPTLTHFLQKLVLTLNQHHPILTNLT